MKTKTLQELDCYIQFKWNNVMNCWNGCLTRNHEAYAPKVGKTYNFIKCFVYQTKDECIKAATKWANANRTKLHNYKG